MKCLNRMFQCLFPFRYWCKTVHCSKCPALCSRGQQWHFAPPFPIPPAMSLINGNNLITLYLMLSDLLFPSNPIFTNPYATILISFFCLTSFHPALQTLLHSTRIRSPPTHLFINRLAASSSLHQPCRHRYASVAPLCLEAICMPLRYGSLWADLRLAALISAGDVCLTVSPSRHRGNGRGGRVKSGTARCLVLIYWCRRRGD